MEGRVGGDSGTVQSRGQGGRIVIDLEQPAEVDIKSVSMLDGRKCVTPAMQLRG